VLFLLDFFAVRFYFLHGSAALFGGYLFCNEGVNIDI